MGLSAALLAWLGVSVLALSSARRGMAAGLLVYAVGLGIATGMVGWPGPVLAVAGVVAAALRLRDGVSGWGLLAPGSTPRLILCVVAGVVCLFLGYSTMADPGDAATRSAVLVGLVIGTARILTTRRRQISLISASLLCLAAGAAEAMTPAGGGDAGVVVAALAAVALGLIPAEEEDPVGA